MNFGVTGRKAHPATRLRTVFRDEIRRALEFGLTNADRLTRLYHPKFARDDMRPSIIQRLGTIGNGHTVRLLEKYAESTVLGRDAIDAIRRIKAEKSGESLDVRAS
jgi:hypothetical protein